MYKPANSSVMMMVVIMVVMMMMMTVMRMMMMMMMMTPIQRRLAWPLLKDDTQNREAFHIFCTALFPVFVPKS